MKNSKDNTRINYRSEQLKKIKQSIFFLFMIGCFFSTAKTQNYDSIVSKIYEYNNFEDIDTAEGGYRNMLGDWMQFYEDRLDENGNIDTYVQNLNAFYSNNNKSLWTDLHWKYIGHTNEYSADSMTMHGLIMKVWADTSDFNHLLAGTELNGLWETYDNGDNWVCISDSEARIKGIASLEVINDTIYIGTNSNEDGPTYYSQGLFYTADHGATWHEQAVVFNGEAIYPTAHWEKRIKQWLHHPNYHNIQFLLTSNYLFRSNDYGATFDTVFYKPKNEYWYNSWYAENTMIKLLINPNNINELFVAGPELLRVSIPQNGVGEIIENLTDNLPIIINDSIRPLYTNMGASKINPEIFWFSVQTIHLNHPMDSTKSRFDIVRYDDNTHDYNRYHAFWKGGTHGIRQIEVSPFSDSIVSVGSSLNYFFKLTQGDTISFLPRLMIHIDIRDTKLYNNNGNLLQLQGTDGGIGKLAFSGESPFNTSSTLTSITNDGTNGIINYHMKGFDVSTSLDHDMMLLAQNHNGVAFVKDSIWKSIYPAMDDGKSVQFSTSNPNELYMTASDQRKLFHYNTETSIKKLLYTYYAPWNYTFPFAVSPNDSRLVYTGEAGKLVAINCQDLNNVVYNELELSPNIKPIHFAVKEAQTFVYVSTNQGKSQDSIFYKFEDNPYNGLTLIKDMSAVINSISDSLLPPGAVISSITLDPFYSNRFWISFKGVDEFPKVWMTEDDGDSFVPYSDGLPNEFPVNEVLFDRLTQRLYAVNDVGIYYYSTFEEKWKTITGDLPPIYCDFIRFSPDHRSLRMGSRSRGPWEASICFYEEDNPIEITSDKTWNNIMHVNSDVNIYDGATLFIIDTAYISPQVHIRIHSGGKLVLNQGKLTNLCDERWQGIEVADGGELVIHNSTIENAELAIRNYFSSIPPSNFGGVIEMLGVTFLNNKKVADIRNSDNLVYFLPSPNDNHIIINDDYIGEDYPNELFSVLNAFLIIRDAIIENSLEGFTSGTVLESNNSFIKCKMSTVKNFNRGFYLTNENTSINEISSISFENTIRAIYANNCNNLIISSNTFNLPTYSDISLNSYGLYLEYCTDYKVEDNLFIGVDDGEGPPEEKANIGLYINNSGSGDNLINNNTFENINYATVSYGQNKGEIGSGTGLCYKCNTFIDNSNDIRVLKSNPPNPGVFVPQGIAASQGADDPSDPSSPAGNQFSYTGPEGTYTDINNKAEHFTYYYHADQPLVNLEPIYYSEKTVTTVEVGAYWNELSCDPDGGGGGGGGGGDKAADNKAKADSVQNFITLIEDGGSPESLRDLVANSLPTDAYQVYIALMAQTPKLSDTTIAKAIEKEEVLGPVMIRDIMAANPKSSKNDELIEKLEERNQPLPDYMLGQILQGRSLGDFMTDLYAKRSYYNKAYHQGIEAMVDDYFSDSLLSPLAQLDSALYLLEAQEDTYFDKYILAYTAAKADYAQVQLLLNNQLSNPKLLNYQEQALEGWQSYYQILASITEEEPDSAQLEAFNNLWLDNKGAASAAARSYLQTYSGLEYEEPLYLGDQMYANGPNEHYEDLVEKAEAHQYIELYPNPAKDYLIVKFDLEQEYSDAHIKISNLQGVLIDSKKLEISKNQILIPTKDYQEGTYTLQLIFGKQARETHKFTVIH